MNKLKEMIQRRKLIEKLRLQAMMIVKRHVKQLEYKGFVFGSIGENLFEINDVDKIKFMNEMPEKGRYILGLIEEDIKDMFIGRLLGLIEQEYFYSVYFKFKSIKAFDFKVTNDLDLKGDLIELIRRSDISDIEITKTKIDEAIFKTCMITSSKDRMNKMIKELVGLNLENKKKEMEILEVKMKSLITTMGVRLNDFKRKG